MDNAVAAYDMDRCHIELYYPYALRNMTLENLRKAFALMFVEYWRNDEAITLTEEYIELCIADAEQTVTESKRSYTNGYKCTKFDFDLSEKEKKRIESQNKKLLQAVARAKKALERMKKIKNIYYEIKEKHKN